ncbi:MAG: hypothetical protein IT297_09940 [Anaerolineae bacterium]|jgi:hypothetical protein|nr:hypothetical protein [Anaerolineae bacterium]MCZ7553553.1 hypothetical protein [Anaerolineales bacterium]
MIELEFIEWRIFIDYGLFVHVPTRPGNFFYTYAVKELDKFAVENGVIMAYTAYVDTNHPQG